jgi:ABC-type transport system involved in multi-copper enzyme maturation permease subunit
MRKILAIAQVTFLEILREKVLYNVLFCGACLLSVGIFASRLSFLQPERVVFHFGLSGLSLSCCALGVLLGASLLGREWERKTAHLVFCRPLSRVHFVLGKYLGLVGVLSLHWVLLALSLMGILHLMFHEAWMSGIFFQALILLCLESFILAGFALFFSTFTTSALSVIFSVGFYAIGNTHSQLRFLEQTDAQSLWKVLRVVLPHFEYFHLGTRVFYQLPMPSFWVLGSVLYAFLMIGCSLSLASAVILSREL